MFDMTRGAQPSNTMLLGFLNKVIGIQKEPKSFKHMTLNLVRQLVRYSESKVPSASIDLILLPFRTEDSQWLRQVARLTKL